MKKCPLCGGKLEKNYCDSCGYSVPDEEGISALYNYDPSDYPAEEPAIREITPEHITEEIYPNRPEPMEFKVREETAETAEKPFVNPYANQDNGIGQTGQTGQTGQRYNMPAQPQNQNPYAGGGFTPYTSNSGSSGSFSDFWKKYWVILLIMLLMPRVLSLILGISMLKSVDKQFRAHMLAATVLLAVFSLW